MINDISLISVKESVSCWQGATKIAVGMLEKSGFVTEDYYQGIIENTKEYGAYYIIAPKVAMPHARPEQGALKNGISLLKLKDPVAYPNEDIPLVNLVFCLSAISSDAHVNVITKIAELIEDEQRVINIINAQDESEILKIIRTA